MDLVAWDPGTPLTLTIAENWAIAGLSCLIGPKSGILKVSNENGDDPEQLTAYDKYACYRRLGLKLLAKPRGRIAVFQQLDAIPDVALLQGQAVLGPRCGYVGHLLMTRKEGPT